MAETKRFYLSQDKLTMIVTQGPDWWEISFDPPEVVEHKGEPLEILDREHFKEIPAEEARKLAKDRLPSLPQTLGGNLDRIERSLSKGLGEDDG